MKQTIQMVDDNPSWSVEEEPPGYFTIDDDDDDELLITCITWCLLLCTQITYNVVVASYALSEIPKVSLRQMAVRSLWGKTSDFLVSLNRCPVVVVVVFFFGKIEA